MASSRFVSEGTDEAPTERGAAWSKAEREVEQKRREKLESEKQGGNNGPSLYETLQANKGELETRHSYSKSRQRTWLTGLRSL